MKRLLSFKAIFCFLCVCYPVYFFSQNNDSLTKLNRKFRHEVAVDLQGLIMRTPGTALIFKVRNGSSTYPEKTVARNLRLQVGFGGTVPASVNTTITDSSTFRYSQKATAAYSVQALAGTEMVHFYGRFNFYYGCDAGYFYSYASSGYSLTLMNRYSSAFSVSNGTFSWLETDTYTNAVVLNPFLGFKYRFATHFSVGIESGVNIMYYMQRTKINTIPHYYNTAFSAKNIATNNTNGFSALTQYIRFFTINYHL